MAEPVDQSPAALAAAETYDAIYNRFFLGGVFNGAYPDAALKGLEPHLPAGWEQDFATISQPVDWCGLNYYTRKVIGPEAGAWPHYAELDGPLPKTQMGWEIYPDGLYRFLTRTAAEYTGDLPLIVTENGMANADLVSGGTVSDPERIAYVDAHLERVQRAIAAGIPVQGYFLWSLLDNYEWALGYEKRFGMVHVDFDTLKRTPKSSYYALQKALRGGAR